MTEPFEEPLPLCDGGKCSRVLAAIAAASTPQKLAERHAAELTKIINGVLRYYGLDPTDHEVMRTIARSLATEVTGEPIPDWAQPGGGQ